MNASPAPLDEPPPAAAPLEVITHAEATELLAALETLKAIADRASIAAYDVPSNITYPRAARAQDFGRLAGVATMAADALFTAVVTAGNYCEQASANRAMDERAAARTAREVTS